MSSAMVAHNTQHEFNNNLLTATPSNASPEELALLAKLDEANRQIETDSKSLNSLSNHSGHSRKSSDTSQISLVSGTSSSQDRCVEDEEDTTIWTQWSEIISNWDVYSKKKNAQLKELVRKGVPHHFRTIIWQYLCGAFDSDVKKLYKEYIKETSACEKVIRRDIARTYPEHDFFKEKDGMGQESLFNVMKAYSLQDREVGYCQGSGFIVGLLLMQMPEEDAFAVFVKIMQDYKMRDMFKPSMAQLGLCMYQLENLVQEIYPELHCHFQAQSFHTSMYASSWFLTLFTTALALPTACRILDVFLSEGMDIIFKVALALLAIGKDSLLSLDMEGMLKYFQKELPVKADSDPDSLMEASYKISYNAKKMKKMEKEYVIMKTKEQEEMVELKRLRNENRLLRQKVELLEKESSELADRLVRGQVSRAEEEETTFNVQRELLALRHTHLETTHSLEVAQEEIKNLSTLLEENHNSCQSSIDEALLHKEKLTSREEIIKCLQDELVKVRLNGAENDAMVRDLKNRIEELEDEKKTLRESNVDNSVAHLQEELIAVKLREAEANLSLKDLKQSVAELNTAWLKHLQDKRKPDPAQEPNSTPKKIGNLLNWNSGDNQKLEEELMSTRLREMEAVTELKQLRLKVMELETQVQVSTNQLKRQDEDNKNVIEELEKSQAKIKEFSSKLKEQNHKYTDLESKIKDDQMMWKIREAEHTQYVAELAQKISRLEMKNEEMVAEGELRYNSLEDSDQVRDLQDKVADMKAEILRLKARESPGRNQSNNIHNNATSTSSTTSELDDTESYCTSDLHLKLNT